MHMHMHANPEAGQILRDLRMHMRAQLLLVD
jgi:hypothetical protein